MTRRCGDGHHGRRICQDQADRHATGWSVSRAPVKMVVGSGAECADAERGQTAGVTEAQRRQPIPMSDEKCSAKISRILHTGNH